MTHNNDTISDLSIELENIIRNIRNFHILTATEINTILHMNKIDLLTIILVYNNMTEWYTDFLKQINDIT